MLDTILLEILLNILSTKLQSQEDHVLEKVHLWRKLKVSSQQRDIEFCVFLKFQLWLSTQEV
jgi:hypothetical protein